MFQNFANCIANSFIGVSLLRGVDQRQLNLFADIHLANDNLLLQSIRLLNSTSQQVTLIGASMELLGYCK